MSSIGPYIPLPELAVASECICGSTLPYRNCCEPRLRRLDRTMGEVERWRENPRYDRIFHVYSDLLWEEQYRDEEQGHSAQAFEEWEEWASYLWLEGVLLDGFTVEGEPSIPARLRERVALGHRVPGGRPTLEALLGSFEGVFEIVTLTAAEGPGLVEIWLPPCRTATLRVPRVFFPADTEPTDMVIGRFVRLGPVAYPTHRPLVIPMLADGSNFDAAYRVLAPLFPADEENAGAPALQARLLKARGDLVLRAALEALLPLETDEIRSSPGASPVDGGEIRWMVSDTAAVELHLDHSPFFQVLGPIDQPELEEEMSDLLQGDSLPPIPEGPRWQISLPAKVRRKLRPPERTRIEELIGELSRKARPPFETDPFEHWATNPGLAVVLDRAAGRLSARAFFAPSLELGRFLLEREVGAFLARESEEYLEP
jgi:hypothetical protein